MQSFDCTKYNRYGFTAQGQGCANARTILCQLQQRFHQLINIGEWIDGDSKRFAGAVLKMILLYTLGILESIGCMSRQLEMYALSDFLIMVFVMVSEAIT